MPAQAVLIVEPKIDFNAFLQVASSTLGYSPSTKIDQDRLDHCDSERLLASLAAFRNPDAPGGITPNLLSCLSYSALILADERDLTDVLQAAPGMAFVVADTVKRGVVLGYLHGTLAQWRDAVKSGSSPDVELSVRALFNQIMSLFEAKGLAFVWKDYAIKPSSHGTFYLEDKRRP